MASLSEAELREILEGCGFATTPRLRRAMAEVDRRARAEERERCAKVAEEAAEWGRVIPDPIPHIASAIRSLKDETETGHG